MYNAVEFKRSGNTRDWIAETGDGLVYIQPVHVVKVQPVVIDDETIPGKAMVMFVSGTPEIVEGAPSEVNRRLQRGS